MYINLNKNNKVKGYTLVELLLILSMVGVIMTMSLPAYRNIQASVGLENTAQALVNDLRLAQQRSISSNDMVAHGVHFYTDSYVVFGDNWGSPSYAVQSDLPAAYEFTAGAGTTVVFDRHSGNTGPATIKLGVSGGDEVVIQIGDGGTMSIN